MEGLVVLSMLFVLALIAVALWLTGRIVGKAGFSGWWALTQLIPIVNIIFVWVFAFADWPNQSRSR